MSKKIWISIGIVIILALAIFGVKNLKKTPVSDEVVKVGVLAGLTGDAAIWGESEKNGIELAVKEINEQGGINGRKIELVIEDTKNTNQGVVAATSKLININQVKYIIGPTWGDTYQGAFPLTDQYETLMITPSASVTAIHNDKVFKNVFSTYYRSDYQGEHYLDIANPEKNIKSMYVLIQNDPYLDDLVSYIEKDALKKNITLTIERVPGHTVDFRTKLLEIKKKNPDLVFLGLGGDTEYYAFYKQRKDLGLQDITIYNYEGISEFGTNPKFKDLLVNTAYVGFEPIPEDFVTKYEKAYSIPPVFAASCAYDTVYILKQALEKTDGSVEKARNYLENNSFDTITFGNTAFDAIHGVGKTKLQLFRYNTEKGDFE